jgi:type IX secretion system PorP/SprF family membrane protein
MFYGDFSYSLRFKKSRSLAFGLKAGLNLINMETASLNTTQESDPHLLTNTLNKVNPNFGFGVYYRSPKLFFGLSTPKIIEQSYDGSAKNREKRHYFAIVGGIIKMNTSWKLRPTAQVKMTAGAPISMDLSVAAIHNDQLYLGAMYRFGSAYGIFVQYQISQQFRVGLASDFGTQALRNYNNGTFEIMLSYDFSFNKEGVRSPRYF